MKKTIYTLLGLLLAAGLTSCQDWFIEKPEVTGMDQDLSLIHICCCGR